MQNAYMHSSIPITSDFDNPNFFQFCDKINVKHGYHRKLWEFVYIFEHLRRAGVLVAGRKGLVFACGGEPLPAVFASLGCDIQATDGPPEITNEGWYREGEHADGLEHIFKADIIDRKNFEERVRFEYCDMNHIPAHLVGFDFCWSACSLEHLGSLRKGMDFVVNSVEQTLRKGGIAVHTTEFNLSSDDKTMETPSCSIYRRRDILALRAELVARGHSVDEVVIPEGAAPPDTFVDLPPYGGFAHLKLQVENYVVTSVGLVITRGA